MCVRNREFCVVGVVNELEIWVFLWGLWLFGEWFYLKVEVRKKVLLLICIYFCFVGVWIVLFFCKISCLGAGGLECFVCVF